MPYFTIIIFTIVFSSLALIIIRSRSLIPQEQGLIPVFKKRCSAIIGKLRYKGPFISFRVYDEFLVVSGFNKIVLNYYDIVKAETVKKWGYNVTQIFHKRREYPDRIILFFYNDSLVDFINSKVVREDEL